MNRAAISCLTLVISTLVGCAEEVPATLSEAAEPQTYMDRYRLRQNLRFVHPDTGEITTVSVFNQEGDVDPGLVGVLVDDCEANLGVEQGCGTSAEFGDCAQPLCLASVTLCTVNLTMELASLVGRGRVLSNGGEVLPSDAPTRAALYEAAARLAGDSVNASVEFGFSEFLDEVARFQGGANCENPVPGSDLSAGAYGLTLVEEVYFLMGEAVDRSVEEYVAASDAAFAESDGATDRAEAATELRRHAASLLYATVQPDGGDSFCAAPAPTGRASRALDVIRESGVHGSDVVDPALGRDAFFALVRNRLSLIWNVPRLSTGDGQAYSDARALELIGAAREDFVEAREYLREERAAFSRVEYLVPHPTVEGLDVDSSTVNPPRPAPAAIQTRTLVGQPWETEEFDEYRSVAVFRLNYWSRIANSMAQFRFAGTPFHSDMEARLERLMTRTRELNNGGAFLIPDSETPIEYDAGVQSDAGGLDAGVPGDGGILADAGAEDGGVSTPLPTSVPSWAIVIPPHLGTPQVVLGRRALQCATQGTVEGARCDESDFSVYSATEGYPDLGDDAPSAEAFRLLGMVPFTLTPTAEMVTEFLSFTDPADAYFFVVFQKDPNVTGPGAYRSHGALRRLTLFAPDLEERAAAIMTPSTRACGRPAVSCAGQQFDARLPLEDELTDDGSIFENSWRRYLTLARTAADEADRLGEQLVANSLELDVLSEAAMSELETVCGATLDLSELNPGRTECATSSDCGLAQRCGDSNRCEWQSNGGDCGEMMPCGQGYECVTGTCRINSIAVAEILAEESPAMQRLLDCIGPDSSTARVALGSQPLCAWVQDGNDTQLCVYDGPGEPPPCPSLRRTLTDDGGEEPCPLPDDYVDAETGVAHTYAPIAIDDTMGLVPAVVPSEDEGGGLDEDPGDSQPATDGAPPCAAIRRFRRVAELPTATRTNEQWQDLYRSWLEMSRSGFLRSPRLAEYARGLRWEAGALNHSNLRIQGSIRAGTGAFDDESPSAQYPCQLPVVPATGCFDCVEDEMGEQTCTQVGSGLMCEPPISCDVADQRYTWNFETGRAVVLARWLAGVDLAGVVLPFQLDVVDVEEAVQEVRYRSRLGRRLRRLHQGLLNIGTLGTTSGLEGGAVHPTLDEFFNGIALGDLDQQIFTGEIRPEDSELLGATPAGAHAFHEVSSLNVIIARAEDVEWFGGMVGRAGPRGRKRQHALFEALSPPGAGVEYYCVRPVSGQDGVVLWGPSDGPVPYCWDVVEGRRAVPFATYDYGGFPDEITTTLNSFEAAVELRRNLAERAPISRGSVLYDYVHRGPGAPPQIDLGRWGRGYAYEVDGELDVVNEVRPWWRAQQEDGANDAKGVMNTLESNILLPDLTQLPTGHLFDALELLCESAEISDAYDSTAPFDCDGPAPEVRSAADLRRAGQWMGCVADSINETAATAVATGLPERARDPLRNGSNVGAVPVLGGEYAQHASSLRVGLNEVATIPHLVAAEVGGLGDDIEALHTQIASLRNRGELIDLSLKRQITDNIAGCASSVAGAAGLETITGGAMAAAAIKCANYVAQSAFAVEGRTLQLEGLSIEEARVIQSLQESLRARVARMSNYAFQMNQAIEQVDIAIASLEADRRKAQRALARALFLDADSTGVVLRSNATSHRRLNTNLIRYQRALGNARSLSFLARRAVEQRFAVDFDEMRDDMSLVEAPSSWASRVCQMEGIDIDRVRADLGGEELDNYAGEFIGDYVTRLENFVESYRIDFPFADGVDTAVVSLRDEIHNVREPCLVNGSNLLLHSVDLGARPSFGVPGWSVLNAVPDGDGDPLPLTVDARSIEHLREDVMVDGMTVERLTQIRPSLNSEFGDPAPFRLTFGGAQNGEQCGVETDCGWHSGLRYGQPVDLVRGRYMVSWFGRDNGDSVVFHGSEPSEIDGPEIAMQMGVPEPQRNGWMRYAGVVEVDEPGVYYVSVQTPPTSGSVVEIGGLMLEAATYSLPDSVQTEDIRPSEFSATENSIDLTLPVCEDTDGDVFRNTKWRRGCVDLCPNGFEGGCSASDAQRYCFWETQFAITLDDIERSRTLVQAGFARGNFNYRVENVALNFVGTGSRVCEDSATPSTCYSAGFIPYSLEHIGPYRVRNHRGNDVEASIFPGRIEHARGLAAERYLTNPLSSADRALVEQFQQRTFRGRPLTGAYRLRVWDEPGVNFEGIEDVQVLLGYRYWTRSN